jgi:transglutaminase-like putative cysteine protease
MHYAVEGATDIILQVAVPSFADQRVLWEETVVSPTLSDASVLATEQYGERRLLRIEDDFDCRYSARVEIDRPLLDISQLPALPPHRLPADAVRYLMPSRYCQSDEMLRFVDDEFGDSEGGERITRLCDWIYEHFSYVPGQSDAQTTAIDTLVHRQGVCRDFAHVLITLARASSIPARFVSAYGPRVTPPDFHALVEVYLDGTWHLVDPTRMAAANDVARIGVGLDAAEVSFMASFGPISLIRQSVEVSRVD